MNGKGILIILMVITVSLSSLVGGRMEKNTVEAAGRPIEGSEVPLEASDADSNETERLGKDFQVEQTALHKEAFQEVFHYEPLPQEIKEKITGVSWTGQAPYSIDDLAYITVTFYGFDEAPHLGRLIMHKQLAPEILDIFKELYDKKFPVEKIELIDTYDAIDEASMNDNNSSALCVRSITNRPNELSKHSFGVAIDINPIQNPYVYQDEVLPERGKEFLDRDHVRKGMIIEGDDCYKAFVSRGWTWGGNWISLKDYQHFEKDIEVSMTGDIPDISEEMAVRHLSNAFIMAGKIIGPCSEETVEKQGRTYARYPRELNSKEKILSNLRLFYTGEAAEQIYQHVDTIIVDDILYGFRNTNEMWNLQILSIKCIEQSEKSDIRKYIVQIQDKEEKIIVVMKYIGSQGWRIHQIQR